MKSSNNRVRSRFLTAASAILVLPIFESFVDLPKMQAQSLATVINTPSILTDNAQPVVSSTNKNILTFQGISSLNADGSYTSYDLSIQLVQPSPGSAPVLADNYPVTNLSSASGGNFPAVSSGTPVALDKVQAYGIGGDLILKQIPVPNADGTMGYYDMIIPLDQISLGGPPVVLPNSSSDFQSVAPNANTPPPTTGVTPQIVSGNYAANSTINYGHNVLSIIVPAKGGYGSIGAADVPNESSLVYPGNGQIFFGPMDSTNPFYKEVTAAGINPVGANFFRIGASAYAEVNWPIGGIGSAVPGGLSPSGLPTVILSSYSKMVNGKVQNFSAPVDVLVLTQQPPATQAALNVKANNPEQPDFVARIKNAFKFGPNVTG